MINITQKLKPKLIIQVKEIQQEAYKEPETLVPHKAAKKTAAVDLSKRLQDLRALNDANSKKGEFLLPFVDYLWQWDFFLFLILPFKLLTHENFYNEVPMYRK